MIVNRYSGVTSDGFGVRVISTSSSHCCNVAAKSALDLIMHSAEPLADPLDVDADLLGANVRRVRHALPERP